jgi:hypothetical protein
MSKIQVNMRLSRETVKELESIAKRQGVSQADVVAVLVHSYHMGWEDDETVEKWFDIAKRT